MNPDTTPKPDRLPPRALPRRRSGRHRDPLSFDSWVGTPSLVLAVPGPAGSPVGAAMAELVRAYRPEVAVRLGHTEGEQETLVDALTDMRPEPERAMRAVIVPLLTAPHPAMTAAIEHAIRATGADARITETLGPHPMLAEVLHQRLAEHGYVRADRMRRISVTAPSGTMADGVVVGAVGGADAVGVAGITSVLLAARLGVTVLPADLDDDAELAQARAQLADAGSVQPVIAPCVVGAELTADTAAVGARYGFRVGAPLGADPLLAKIAAWRYAEVLNALGVEAPPTLDELPAPVGSRHRPQS